MLCSIRVLKLVKTCYKLQGQLTFMLHIVIQRLYWAAEISFTWMTIWEVCVSKSPFLLLTQSFSVLVCLLECFGIERDEEENNVFNLNYCLKVGTSEYICKLNYHSVNNKCEFCLKHIEAISAYISLPYLKTGIYFSDLTKI